MNVVFVAEMDHLVQETIPVTKPVERQEIKPMEKQVTKPVERQEMKPTEKPATKPVARLEMKPVGKLELTSFQPVNSMFTLIQKLLVLQLSWKDLLHSKRRCQVKPQYP